MTRQLQSRWVSLGIVASCAVAALTCSDEPAASLFINFTVGSLPDDTVSTPRVNIGGEIVRIPARASALKWVTITGGAQTIVDTANSFGIFDATIPLTENATNMLEFVAGDNTGAMSTRLGLEVVHRTVP
jgi:hypothetical protein